MIYQFSKFQNEWKDAMEENDAVKSYFLAPKYHYDYSKSLFEGNAKFDL